jgi:hypothetical protein
VINLSKLRRILQAALSHFQDTAGMLMQCPVPTRSGRLVALKYVYSQWKSTPAENHGTFFASFMCPITGRSTSLVSVEQLDLILPIAFDLGITTSLPFKCQFLMDGVWTDFPYMEQISIAAMLCKLNFHKLPEQVECLLVCNNSFVLEIRVTDNGNVTLEISSPRGGGVMQVRVMLPAHFVFENLHFTHMVLLDH